MQSKTTLVRRRKIDGLCESLNSLIYFIANYQKRDLWLVKGKDLKELRRICSYLKDGLVAYEKESKISNTQPKDEDSASREKDGINL
jgi:hypothetical protein